MIFLSHAARYDILDTGMAKFDQLKYRFWDRVGTIVELIERWQPPAKSHSMSQYEQSLCGFLQRNLPDVRITTRSGHGSDTARIALSPDLLIELRANLNTIDECQRLLSELPAMIKASKAFVVIVFAGNVDIALIKSLRRRLREWSADLVIEMSVRVVVKPLIDLDNHVVEA